MSKATRRVARTDERVDMNHCTTKRPPRLLHLLARINGSWPQSRVRRLGDLTTPIAAARPSYHLA